MSVRDREAKFIKLMERRVNNVLHQLKLVENLANKQNYTYSNEDANKALTAISKRVDRVKEVFARPEINYEKRFTLRGGDDD